MNIPVLLPGERLDLDAMPSSRTGTVARGSPRATRDPAANPSSSAYEAGEISKMVLQPSSASSASKISARRLEIPSVVICATAASP